MAGIAMVDAPSPVGYGWDDDGGIQWIEEMLPDDISVLFIHEDNSDDEEIDDNIEDFFGGEESEIDDDSDFED